MRRLAGSESKTGHKRVAKLSILIMHYWFLRDMSVFSVLKDANLFFVKFKLGYFTGC